MTCSKPSYSIGRKAFLLYFVAIFLEELLQSGVIMFEKFVLKFELTSMFYFAFSYYNLVVEGGNNAKIIQ